MSTIFSRSPGWSTPYPQTHSVHCHVGMNPLVGNTFADCSDLIDLALCFCFSCHARHQRMHELTFFPFQWSSVRCCRSSHIYYICNPHVLRSLRTIDFTEDMFYINQLDWVLHYRVLICMYALHIFLSWRKEMLSLEQRTESAFTCLPPHPLFRNRWGSRGPAGRQAGLLTTIKSHSGFVLEHHQN